MAARRRAHELEQQRPVEAGEDARQPRVDSVGVGAGRAHQQVGVAVAVHVAGAAHGGAEGVATRVAAQEQELRAIETGVDHGDAGSGGEGPAGLGGAQDDVGEAVGVHVAGVAHRVAQLVVGRRPVECVEQRAVGAGERPHSSGVVRRAVVPGGADEEIAEAVLVQVSRAAHGEAAQLPCAVPVEAVQDLLRRNGGRENSQTQDTEHPTAEQRPTSHDSSCQGADTTSVIGARIPSGESQGDRQTPSLRTSRSWSDQMRGFLRRR